MIFHVDDFTEKNYRAFVRRAREAYQIVPFVEHGREGRVCLWRHDIDYSVHRAQALATIESEEEVRASYFVLVHGNFYSLLEREIVDLLRSIVGMGHEIGLHFDPAYYTNGIGSRGELERLVGVEKTFLEDLFDTSVGAISFHNPDTGDWQATDDDEIAGLVNAYGRTLQREFSYCSDSNGYWRHRRLSDVLEAAEDDKLHVLTHPALWTPEPMAPRQRIARCIGGRARRQHDDYDRVLAQSGRVNVRHGAEEEFSWLHSWDAELCHLIEDLLLRESPHLARIELVRRLGESDVSFSVHDEASEDDVVALVLRLRAKVGGQT